MHRIRRCAVGALALTILLAGCGGDDGGDDEATSDFCAARVDLGDRITELQGFDLTSEEDVPEARERVIALIDALRTMLDAAPEEIRIQADTMAEGLDDVEARVTEATAVELGTEVPALLAEVGGAGSDQKGDAVAAVNAYAEDECD